MLLRAAAVGRRFLATPPTFFYTAEAVAAGAGRNGTVRVPENAFEAKMVTPPALGGKGIQPGELAFNPELFFASGYASCFLGTMGAVANKAIGKAMPGDTSLTSLVHLGRDTAGGLKLAVELKLKAPSLSKDEAQKLVGAAHEACVYSKAIRNNVDVKLTVQ